MQYGLIILLLQVVCIAEARVRYGLPLKAGRKAEAKTVLTETLAGLKRAPKYVRRAQAEWIALAEKALRG
jgi:hypothetical protein